MATTFRKELKNLMLSSNSTFLYEKTNELAEVQKLEEVT